jgi:hypothetical protein
MIAVYTLNRLFTWFGLIALLVAVFDATHSALAVAASLLAGQALPAFAVAVVAPRVLASPKHRELSGLYIFEAMATAGLAAVLGRFWLPGVLMLAVLDGTAALAASALLRAEVGRAARDYVEEEAETTARRAGGVEIKREEAERVANRALKIGFSSAFVLGPALAAPVVAALGPPVGLLIDAGSFLLCGVLVLDLHPDIEEVVAGVSVRALASAAFHHILETPALRPLMLVEASALVFFESAGPVEVVYAKATLDAGDLGFGLLVTSWGAGAVLGSLIFVRLVKQSLAVTMSIGAMAVGLAYLGFAVAPSLPLVCIAAVVGGIGNGIQWPSFVGLVQRLTPEQLQGTMMGGLESVAAMSMAIALPLGGVLVALSSPRTAFLVVGACATLSALTIACFSFAHRLALREPATTDTRKDPASGKRNRDARSPESTKIERFGAVIVPPRIVSHGV